MIENDNKISQDTKRKIISQKETIFQEIKKTDKVFRNQMKTHKMFFFFITWKFRGKNSVASF